MSDLTDERLAELVHWSSNDGYGGMPDTHTALLELQLLRAAVVANEEWVRAAVREAIREAVAIAINSIDRIDIGAMIDAIATRAAKQLATAAVRLSADEQDVLVNLRTRERTALDAIGHLGADVRVGMERTIAVLDRLLATGAKP